MGNGKAKCVKCKKRVGSNRDIASGKCWDCIKKESEGQIPLNPS